MSYLNLISRNLGSETEIAILEFAWANLRWCWLIRCLTLLGMRNCDMQQLGIFFLKFGSGYGNIEGGGDMTCAQELRCASEVAGPKAWNHMS